MRLCNPNPGQAEAGLDPAFRNSLMLLSALGLARCLGEYWTCQGTNKQQCQKLLMRFGCELVPGALISRAAALGCVSTELAMITALPGMWNARKPGKKDAMGRLDQGLRCSSIPGTWAEHPGLPVMLQWASAHTCNEYISARACSQ